jgi:hypothetical protein
MRLSPASLLSLLAVIIVVGMGVAFMLVGVDRLPAFEMGPHGWFALGLGTVLSVVIGGVLTTVLVVSRRNGFDETAHEARLDLSDEP